MTFKIRLFFFADKVDILSVKFYIVVPDVVKDVTSSRKSVNTCVVITLLLHFVIDWKPAASYDKQRLKN